MNTPRIVAYRPAPKLGDLSGPKDKLAPQLAAKRSPTGRSPTPSTGVPTSPKGQPGPLEQMSKRFWIKVRMNGKNADVQPILERWRSQKLQAENLATAIRLLDAVQRGDLDAVREIAPLLSKIPGAGTSKRSRKVDPLIESIDSKEESGDQGNQQNGDDLAQAIAEITLHDLVINRRAVKGLAFRLRSAGYSAQDLRDWYERYWRLHDWRGKKGDRPTLKDVQRLIGHVRTLSELTDPPDIPPADDPYLRNPYFHRHSDDPEPNPDPEPEPDPEPRQIDRDHADKWLATLGQLQIQLNTATYDTWLRHAVLVEAHNLTWRVSVPHQYAKDWIERHLLHAIKHDLADMMSVSPGIAEMTGRPIRELTADDVTVVLEVG